MKLGIDMHNVRDGGGVNYTSNLLRAFNSRRHGFDQIHVFGSEQTLSKLPERPDVIKHAHPMLARSLPWRLWFMRFRLDAELHKSGCDVLYSPGGLYFGRFRPYTTISRNMMPYEPRHWSMYPLLSVERLRLVLVRFAHNSTFRNADGMIFLTTIARRIISNVLGRVRGEVTVISHGVNHALFNRTNLPPLVKSLETEQAIRLVYPSRLEPYKHQVEVIKASALLKREFPGLTLELCGPANAAYRAKVEEAMRLYDPQASWIAYHGELSNQLLPDLYAKSHILVFASSCENLPNTLIEAMAFGIPTVSSSAAPMPEVAADACLYFDPKNPESIAGAIRQTLLDWPGTLTRVQRGTELAAGRSWDHCADETFRFLLKQTGTTAHALSTATETV